MADRNHTERANFGKLREVIQTPNLIEMTMIIQDIREDHGVPNRKGDLQRFPGLVFTRLAREMKYGRGEMQEGLGDFSIGMSY